MTMKKIIKDNCEDYHKFWDNFNIELYALIIQVKLNKKIK